jgi:hypothetical protein
MIKRKRTRLADTKFSRIYDLEVGNFTINSGDLIKITGEHGMRFKFHSLTTNTETGVTWVDCFEVHKRAAGCFRSFRVDRVRRIPTKRGKRVANVS